MSGKLGIVITWVSVAFSIATVNEYLKTLSILLAIIASCYTIYYFRKKIKHDFKSSETIDPS